MLNSPLGILKYMCETALKTKAIFLSPILGANSTPIKQNPGTLRTISVLVPFSVVEREARGQSKGI